MSLALPSPRVVFENERLLILNKHAHWSFHAETSGTSGYFHHMKTLLLASRTCDLYPCHRLDRVTSGCLLLAKDAETARRMGELFQSKLQDRRVNKTYVALSNRKPKKKMGRITGDMVKSRRGSWKLARSTENPSTTTFESISYQTSVDSDASASNRMYAFVVRPLTGRTHQIRVALKSIGSPILGDARYGNALEARDMDRTYLHSASIAFNLDGEDIHVVCPPFGDEMDDAGVYFADKAFKDVWMNQDWSSGLE
jgi:tRNA pseudouridine32 synthase/23S rRNA pseudouridine746 synthase